MCERPAAVARLFAHVALLCLTLAITPFAAAQATATSTFDHSHAAWDTLLHQHVVVSADGTASTVDYRAMAHDRALLKAYLANLSAVTPAEFAAWTKAQRLAFLINAYNAFTVELILTRYPQLDSIKDIGGFFSSPWKQRFFSLLGAERHLDDIEHGMIRAPAAYDEPRIHVAVVCASIGCPMLRNDAFTAERLDAQLADAMHRFLSDRTRNRYDASNNTLMVSKIFDWYGKDFGVDGDVRAGLLKLFERHADALAPDAASRARLSAAIADGSVRIQHLDYDWKLNDAH